jgi:hypothetical protein
MAKINALLKLNSNTPLGGSAFLNFIDEYEIQVTDADTNVQSTTASSLSNVTILSSVTDSTDFHYVYLQNTHATENLILLTGGDVECGFVPPLSSLLIGVKRSIGLKLKTDSSTITVNRIIFKKSS